MSTDVFRALIVRLDVSPALGEPPIDKRWEWIPLRRRCQHLQGMAPEEVCVNDVTEVALTLLPDDLNGLMGKSGSIEMCVCSKTRLARSGSRKPPVNPAALDRSRQYKNYG